MNISIIPLPIKTIPEMRVDNLSLPDTLAT